MRHQNKGFKLGRTQAHRKATLAALSTALIRHKRITTTLTKARALRMYVEPLVNRAKEDSTLNRRQVFRRLQDKVAVTELFGDIASRIAERPGGYTRIVKLGQRAGDSAEMAMIELVDYNDVRPFGSSDGKKKRTRRGARGKAAAATVASSDVVVATAEPEASVEAVEEVEEVPEAAVAAVEEEAAPEPEAAVEAVEDVEEVPEAAVAAVEEEAAPEPEVAIETPDAVADDAAPLDEASADEAEAEDEGEEEAKTD